MTRMNVFIVTDLEILVLKLPRINRTDHKFLNGSRIEKKKKFIISPLCLKKMSGIQVVECKSFIKQLSFHSSKALACTV